MLVQAIVKMKGCYCVYVIEIFGKEESLKGDLH